MQWPTPRNILWNGRVICISKTNIIWNLDIQISLQLKDSSWGSQQAVGNTWLKRNMTPTKELSIEAMESIVKLIQKGNTPFSVGKDVGG